MGQVIRHIQNLPLPFVAFEERIVQLPTHGWRYLDNVSFKIVCMLESSIEYRINGVPGASHFETGDVLVIPCACRQNHRSTQQWSDRHFVAGVLRLDPRLMVSYETAMNHDKPPPAPDPGERNLRRFLRTHFSRFHHLKGVIEGDLATNLRLLIEEAERPRPGYRLQAMALCQQIVIALGRLIASRQSIDSGEAKRSVSRTQILVEALRHYLNDNSRLPLTMVDLSRIFGRSEAHLAAAFKKATGHTIFQEINHIRLDKAKRLLLSTELSARDIARETGFRDPSVFSRNFRRHVGVPPQAYRLAAKPDAKFTRTREPLE